jgi:Family of unknown function (DUF6325)
MTVGPLDLVVLGFEGNRFSGEIVEELDRLVSAGTIRLVDLVFASKDADGGLSVDEIQDLKDEDLAPFAGLVDQLGGLLTMEDLEALGEGIPANSSAGILLFEHTWAVALKEAVARAGGFVIATEHIAPEMVDALNAELAASGS